MQQFGSELILFLFKQASRNIVHTMSQQQHLDPKVQNLQPSPQSTEPPVNPQNLHTNNQQQANDELQTIQNEDGNLRQIDLKTPKRNRSQERSNYFSQKQTPNKASLSLSHSTQNSIKARLKTADRIPEEQQDSDHKNYEDLTMKLQIVLNKISSSKPMVKSVHQNQNMIVRFEQCEQRKKKLIDRKKEQYEEQKIRQLKDKPTIDKKSNQISKEIGHKPIYLRVDALVQEKKKKLEKNQQLRKKKLEQEEQTFIEEYNKHVKKPENVRSYDQYFNEMVRWKQKRAKQNQQKLQIKQSKQLQGITFQPLLNPKSKKMVLSHQRLPIEQRGLIKTKKPFQLKEQGKTYKKITTNI